MTKLPSQRDKQEQVRRRGHSFSTLVETGTHTGDTIWAVKDSFSTIHSIELGDELYRKAIIRFKDIKYVYLHHGDSTDVLKWLVPDLPPSLFWLDGHFSGGNTAKGVKETPIVEELETILATGVGHGILIDDARCFGKLPDFPTLAWLEELIGPFELVNDIIWKDLGDVT